jgi:hypothetical protein
MTLMLPSSLVPPDIRFAALPALARPGSGRMPLGADGILRAKTTLAHPESMPTYLLLADRDAELVADGPQSDEELLELLAASLRQECGQPQSDLILLVGAMEILDRAFRATGLWRGNIYLAGYQSLESLTRVLSWTAATSAGVPELLRDLQALELIYLFPVASKFRRGRHDGDVQFRLNGWGRSLASRLPWPLTSAMKDSASALLAAHLDTHHDAYARHLSNFDVNQQEYAADLFAAAKDLPIPVLVLSEDGLEHGCDFRGPHGYAGPTRPAALGSDAGPGLEGGTAGQRPGPRGRRA